MKKFFFLCITTLVIVMISIIVITHCGAFENPSQEETTETSIEEIPIVDHISLEWAEKIKSWEGLTLHAVNDCGYWAIGYGHQVCSISDQMPQSITMEEAEELFHADILQCETKVLTWADSHEIILSQEEFESFVSFVYQFGFRNKYMNEDGFVGMKFIQWKNGSLTTDELWNEWQQYCHYTDSNGIRKVSNGILERRTEEFNHFTE